ncbi:hypothetical protein GCM10010515_40080 [Streptomyces fructofermentans]|uniref:Uncharacterized protein n=1 Tax=Streptomyces fructofermentans TaxID=152141 RepID=A0A918KLG7_9ACTN|nr:hypothetical protein GCM10010515_40080 [Streptomyces fructofermentans]
MAYCTAKCLGSQTRNRLGRGTRLMGTEGFLRFLRCRVGYLNGRKRGHRRTRISDCVPAQRCCVLAAFRARSLRDLAGKGLQPPFSDPAGRFRPRRLPPTPPAASDPAGCL